MSQCHKNTATVLISFFSDGGEGVQAKSEAPVVRAGEPPGRAEGGKHGNVSFTFFGPNPGSFTHWVPEYISQMHSLE